MTLSFYQTVYTLVDVYHPVFFLGTVVPEEKDSLLLI